MAKCEIGFAIVQLSKEHQFLLTPHKQTKTINMCLLDFFIQTFHIHIATLIADNYQNGTAL
jgi:hypothetical protein